MQKMQPLKKVSVFFSALPFAPCLRTKFTHYLLYYQIICSISYYPFNAYYQRFLLLYYYALFQGFWSPMLHKIR